jgi:hypothetical protein
MSSCTVPDECPQEIADLLAACLYAKPAEPLSAAQIVLILREHLGSARQPPLPLERPLCRLERRSDYSFSMDKLAEQKSTRGAEAVQFQARRFWKVAHIQFCTIVALTTDQTDHICTTHTTTDSLTDYRISLTTHNHQGRVGTAPNTFHRITYMWRRINTHEGNRFLLAEGRHLPEQSSWKGPPGTWPGSLSQLGLEHKTAVHSLHMKWSISLSEGR